MRSDSNVDHQARTVGHVIGTRSLPADGPSVTQPTSVHSLYNAEKRFPQGTLYLALDVRFDGVATVIEPPLPCYQLFVAPLEALVAFTQVGVVNL